MIRAQGLMKLQLKCLLGLQLFGGKTGAEGFISKLDHDWWHELVSSNLQYFQMVVVSGDKARLLHMAYTLDMQGQNLESVVNIREPQYTFLIFLF